MNNLIRKFGKAFIHYLSRPSALIERERVIKTGDSVNMLCLAENYIERTILETGVWENAETETVRNTVLPGQVCLDVGANIGYFCLLMAKLGATVHAYEPTTYAFNRMKANIALNPELAQNIFLLDTDLGMANSHVLLGVNPDSSISDVISGKKKIIDVVIQCNSGIYLISGGTAENNLLNLDNKKRYSILNEIDAHLQKNRDVKLLVDIAAGAEDNSLVFAMACDRILIVLMGEPTSFLDSYALIKAIFAKSSFKNYCIVVNQVKSDSEGRSLFEKFRNITLQFLDVNLHYVGCIKTSINIKKSIIERNPIMHSQPNSDSSLSFTQIIKKVYKTPVNEWGGLTFLSKIKKRA